MKYFVDNIRNYSHMRGWICGQFFPEGSPNQNTDLEVKIENLKPGDAYSLHYHPIGREVIIIVSGQARWTLNGEERLLSAGDFILMESGVHESIPEILEPTVTISIRTPSVPDNKIET